MNERQFRVKTRIVAVRDVKEYRATIAVCVGPDDTVLEIGCEWGTTTGLIAPRCRQVVGTDISPECVERARRRRPGIRFEVLDGFDVLSALRLGVPFTKVYIDMSGLSGYRSLLDTIALVSMYATVLRPQAVIVKSAALKHFASCCTPWRGGQEAGVGDIASG
jgi:trans-aconitate methyltransferase